MLAASSASKSTPIFLLPNGTIIIELIIFLIVLGTLAKFVLPSLQQARDERERRIADSLRAGTEGRAEAAALEAERLSVLDAARAEARALLEGAERTVEHLRSEARERAQGENDQVLAEAEARLAGERDRVWSDASSHLGEVVVAAAESVIGAEIDATRHRDLIERAIASSEGGNR